MESLIEQSRKQVENTSLSFKRFLFSEIPMDKQLVIIRGARGTGKTTLLLQLLKEYYESHEAAMYVSLDQLYFANKNLLDFAEQFAKYGGKHLFLDEVHKYPNWSREIKNIYDSYPELKVILTGSSILEIAKSEADLSRRAIKFDLPAMSLREFIEFYEEKKIQPVSLTDILNNHSRLTSEINKQIKPLKSYHDYLKFGAYPFFKTSEKFYHPQLESIVNVMLETDLPAIVKTDFSSIHKIKKLLYIISQSVPFKPNISELSRKTGIMRDTLLKYLHHLAQARLVHLLQSESKGISFMNKPEKIYLENTNLLYSFGHESPDTGNLRETFFLSQVSKKHEIHFSNESDFLVNRRYTFEIGGKNKTRKQIAGLPDSYIAADNIEYSFRNKIPLWLFGFLY